MQLQITRDELKREAELLTLLERYEALSLSTKEYNQGEMHLKVSLRDYGLVDQKFSLDPHNRIVRGSENLSMQDRLNAIMTAQVEHGLLKCVSLIKHEMKLQVTE